MAAAGVTRYKKWGSTAETHAIRHQANSGFYRGDRRSSARPRDVLLYRSSGRLPSLLDLQTETFAKRRKLRMQLLDVHANHIRRVADLAISVALLVPPV